MRLRFKAFLVFAIAFVSGVLGGLIAFRTALSFTKAGEKVQDQFSQACMRGDVNTMTRLYVAGALPNGRIVDGGPEGPTGYPPDPPLCMATMYGRANAVQWLVDHDANVNELIDGGDGFYTALDNADYYLKNAQLNARGVNTEYAARVKKALGRAQKAVDILISHGAKTGREITNT